MTDVTGGPEQEWQNEIEDRQWFGDGEHGFWQLIPPGPMPESREISEEEQIEAAVRYMKAKYATDPDLFRGIERVTGETYDEETGTWHSNPSVS